MKVKYVLRNNEKYISNKIPGYRFLQSLYLSPVSFLLNMYGALAFVWSSVSVSC